MTIRFLKTVLLSLGLTALACIPDAPRDNPLDPAIHRETSQATLHGQVLQKKPPHFPVSGCLVLLEPEQRYTTSDQNGLFTLAWQKADSHFLTLSKEGFDAKRLLVDPDSLAGDLLGITLNGKPRVNGIKLYSEYIDQWWPDPVATLNAELRADDPDGLNDLTAIYLTVGDDSMQYAFSPTAAPDSFVLQVDAFDLPGQNLSELVGVDFWVHLQDSSQSHTHEGPYHLVRVMTISPTALSPAGLEETSAQPVLQWQAYNAAFRFTFEVSVFHITAGIPVRIFLQQSLPADQTQFQYPDSLSSGSYFWTIGVRDQYDDLVRSKEASFIVP